MNERNEANEANKRAIVTGSFHFRLLCAKAAKLAICNVQNGILWIFRNVFNCRHWAYVMDAWISNLIYASCQTKPQTNRSPNPNPKQPNETSLPLNKRNIFVIISTLKQINKHKPTLHSSPSVSLSLFFLPSDNMAQPYFFTIPPNVSPSAHSYLSWQ